MPVINVTKDASSVVITASLMDGSAEALLARTAAQAAQAGAETAQGLSEAARDTAVAAVGGGLFAPKAITISYPTATENLTLFRSDAINTITALASVLKVTAASSITFTIKYGADRAGAGTEIKTGGFVVSSSTTGLIETSFDNAAIPAGNFVWVEVLSLSGSIQELHINLSFT